MQISKIYSNNAIFGKKLEAKCNVKNKTNGKVPCKIYSISPEEEKDYFTKALKHNGWEHSKFIEYMFSDSPELKNEPGRSVYSIENPKGECIGFTEVNKRKYDMEINILETAPNLANNTKNSHSPVKYVGETLLSFVINKAYQGLNHEINLYPGKSSVGFYADKCLMDYDDKKKLCTLPFIRYGVILQQNAEHTGSLINLVR